MKDTSDEIERMFRNLLLARPGEERLKMGCSMHAAARALVIASISEKDPIAVKQALFLRFYGHEFEPKERQKILRALRKAAEGYGKRINSDCGAVREEQAAYRRKRKNRARS